MNPGEWVNSEKVGEMTSTLQSLITNDYHAFGSLLAQDLRKQAMPGRDRAKNGMKRSSSGFTYTFLFMRSLRVYI